MFWINWWLALALISLVLVAVLLILAGVIRGRPYAGVEEMRKCPHCRRDVYTEGGRDSVMREHYISPGIVCRGERRAGQFEYEE